MEATAAQALMNIEVEVRSFITEEQFERLLSFFKKNGEFCGEEEQETHYLDAPADLRIQKNSSYAKVWLKGGKLHDDHREEIEVRVPREDFEKLERLFTALGCPPKIKWFRTRRTFRWHGVTVCLDNTKGYGRIIELEKMTDETGKDAALAKLKEKLAALGVPPTPKEEFEKKFADYEKNWRALTA